MTVSAEMGPSVSSAAVHRRCQADSHGLDADPAEAALGWSSASPASQHQAAGCRMTVSDEMCRAVRVLTGDADGTCARKRRLTPEKSGNTAECRKVQQIAQKPPGHKKSTGDASPRDRGADPETQEPLPSAPQLVLGLKKS